MNEQLEKLRKHLDIQIPDSLLTDIVALFKDGDETNWSPGNVTYKFKDGPKECPFHPGYYYIPGYSRYVVNKNGEVKKVINGHVKKWYTSKPDPRKNITGGYKLTSAVRDIGGSLNLTRHRALCLTFKSYDEHPGKFWINYLNGIPGSDSLDNLEFCTPSQNIKHAYDNGLHANKVRPIDAHNWKTGETISFDTVQKCVDYTGLLYPTIFNRLRAGSARRHEDGWRFKDKDASWEPLHERIGQKSDEVAITFRNVFTNEIFIAPSLNAAAEHTGVLSGSIQRQAADQVLMPINGWNFRYLDNFEGWPNYTEKHLEVFKKKSMKPADAVEVFDLETGEMLFFIDSVEAGKHFGISPITASKLARYERIRQGRYKFKLFRLRESLGPLIQ